MEEAQEIHRPFWKGRPLSPVLLGGVFVLVVALAVWPLVLSRGGGAQVGWHLTRGWRVGVWTRREVEWDEPLPGQPPPPQVSRVRVEQYGPLVVETRRRVPALPSDGSAY